MILGLLFRKIGLFKDEFVKQMNTYVFKVALPVLLFEELSTEDFVTFWDGKFVLFCFVVTLLEILICAGVSMLFSQEIRGEFIQSAFRSSAALLGIGFIQNIYGNAGMSPMMIIGSVPLYNITAVVVLTYLNPQRHNANDHPGLNAELVRKTLFGIITNPIILGIIIGIAWSLLKIPQPVIFSKMIQYLARTATPLGLMAMGASFHGKQALSMLKPTLVATILKLTVFCAAFIPLAVHFGFREDTLVSTLVMLGSPTTVSCYIMARNMGHKGTLSSSVVMLTTLLSAFTLTAWLYLLKNMGLI